MNNTVFDYRVGHSFTSDVYEPAIAIPIMTDWLQNQPKVRFIQKRLRNIDEIMNEEYDFVINCTGVGARFFVNDTNIRPISGHVLSKALKRSIGKLGSVFVKP